MYPSDFCPSEVTFHNIIAGGKVHVAWPVKQFGKEDIPRIHVPNIYKHKFNKQNINNITGTHL